MRIVFLGHQGFGHATLAALCDSAHTVALAIGHPQGGTNPYDGLWAASVCELARAQDVDFAEARDTRETGVADLIAEASPDVIVAADWRTWIPPDVREIAPRGAVNLHEGLLPRYGGCAPLNWAIANGETAVGVTAHLMTDEFDLGDILTQTRLEVADDESVTDVYPRVRSAFPRVALETLESLDTGTAVRYPQDRRAATYFHKRTERDSRIDWRAPSQVVRNLIRAQADPYPNAYTLHDGEKLRIKRSRLSDRKYRGSPGRVCARTHDGVIVLCGNPTDAATTDGASQGLVVLEVEPSAGGSVPASDFFSTLGQQFD